MKTIRHILIFILIFLPQHILGQEMYVHSFSHVPSDLSAKVTPKKDTNGELCALVKVAFVEKDADFFGSVLKPVKRLSGIYWVYMPKGSYRLRVLHDSFLPLDIDFLSYSGVGKLESGETYELVLKTKGGNNQNNSVNGNFLVLNVTPGHASVKVDGKMITVNDKGEAKAFLNNGTHTYSIEANGYLPVNEEVVISGERVIRNISLQSDRPTLTILATTAGTEIYVNEELKGIDGWRGNIDEGTCLIEGRKTGYKTYKMTAVIYSGKNNYDTIPALIKSVGSLIVNYEPTDADIYLDNKYIGKTPNVINDIQIGQHELKISKDGYDTFTKSLVVKEEQTEISGTLTKSIIAKYEKESEPKPKKNNNVPQPVLCWSFSYFGSLKKKIGNIFVKGIEGLSNKNYKKAKKCFGELAEKGYNEAQCEAQCNLGVCYYLTQEYSEAVKWYRKAAEQDNVTAQYNLGICYELGHGVTKDLQEAIRWYKLGAEKGEDFSVKALSRLGVSQ